MLILGRTVRVAARYLRLSIRIVSHSRAVDRSRHADGCRGQDLNLGTPSRADLESAAFGHSATPARSCRLRAGRGVIGLPLRRARGRPTHRSRGPGPRTGWPAAYLRLRRPGERPDGAGPGGPNGTRGSSARDVPAGTGSGPCAPRPSAPSSGGSRPTGIRGGPGRCSASRSAERAARSDRGTQYAAEIRSRPTRRGPRSDRGRPGSSGRCAGPDARGGRGLGVTAYRANDRDGRYQRVAARAMDDASDPGRRDPVGSRRRRGREGQPIPRGHRGTGPDGRGWRRWRKGSRRHRRTTLPTEEVARIGRSSAHRAAGNDPDRSAVHAFPGRSLDRKMATGASSGLPAIARPYARRTISHPARQSLR
jgi:hypothetical protein